jgi:ubiquinone/menaquinone biosynthesis C-methylase UbiE
MTNSTDLMIDNQRERFDGETVDYDRHHMNKAAQAYRDRFIREKLFDADLRGKDVLDAMCATGIDTPFFLRRGAKVAGLDISPNCAAVFEERYRSECRVASMHDTGFEDRRFDVVFIGGGLHHIAAEIPACIDEIERILKPGGVFCALEPNHDDWSNRLRKLWYRLDSRFEDNERALSYAGELKPLTGQRFREEAFFKGGNLAYLSIQQAGTLRTPKIVLNHASGWLMALETMLTAIPGVPKLYWCCRWRKTAP